MKTSFLKPIDSSFIGIYAFVFSALFYSAAFAQNIPVKSSDVTSDFIEIPQIKWEFKTSAPIFSSPVINSGIF